MPERRITWVRRQFVAGSVFLLVACQAEQLVETQPPETFPPGLEGMAIRLDVDLVHDQIHVVLPAAPGSSGDGPSFALVGANEVSATASNIVRSAPGAFQPNKVRVTFDVALTNRLTSSSLVPPTWPTGVAGTAGLLLFPFKVSAVAGGIPSQVLASSDWNGNGTPGSGGPRNFFNDSGCPVTGITSDCLRWEQFAAPLYPGVTTAKQNVGFDLPKAITAFSVYVALAADIQNDLPAPQRLVVTPSSYLMNDGFPANFSAVAYDINNQPLTWVTIHWTVADITAAEFQYGSALVGSITGPSVIVHGRKVGQTSFTASTGGLTVTVPLDVQVNTIVLVQPYVLPDSDLVVGEQVQAVASVKDNSGNIVPGFNPTWSTSDPGVVTVDPATGLITATGPGTVTITATAAAASGTIPITVNPPTTGDIAGTMLDLDGQAVAGATVHAVGPVAGGGPPVDVYATTSVTGAYLMANLSSGNYILDWSPAGCVAGSFRAVAVQRGQTTTFDITVDCPPTVSGVLTPVQGALPAGLTVELRPDIGGNNIVAAVQSDGSYLTPGFPAGGYFIFVNYLPGNCTAFGAQSISLTQQAKYVKHWRVDCPPVGAIAGTVKDLDGQPVAGATVLAQMNLPQPGPQLSTTTDAQGNFGFALLPPGGYSVSAQKPGTSCSPAFGLPLVTAGQTAAVPFLMDCPWHITGTVAAQGGLPSGLVVTMQAGSESAPVQPDGTYDLTELPSSVPGPNGVILNGIPQSCVATIGSFPGPFPFLGQQMTLTSVDFALDCRLADLQ
ncbi:MAG: carboxypeptidase-like regulatory domain-containing protein, partial [Gemmatimonadota bacterium]|nr:carboxypeptidase-like regulatory domain-containing protein [Gemmatimonadota bacterium]